MYLIFWQNLAANFYKNGYGCILILLPLIANILLLDYYMPMEIWKRVKRLESQYFFQSTVEVGKKAIINELTLSQQ